MMKKRTRFVVKIIVEEKLPMTNYSQELNIYNMNFTSDKYHCDCEGLQNEIRELLWEPYSAKFFTGGRYFKSALVKAVGANETYGVFENKRKRRKV